MNTQTSAPTAHHLRFQPPIDEHHGVPQKSARSRRVAFWSGLAVLPATLGVALKALSGSSRGGTLTGVGAAVALGVVRSQWSRWFTEERPYTLERTVGDLEIRRYPKVVCAETTVDAPSFEASLGEGFHRLVAYIRENHIPMTTPVVTTRSDTVDSESVPMRSDARFIRAGAGAFTMRFMMPADRTPDSMPICDDPRVHIRTLPEQRLAVLRFAGRWSEATLEREGHRLEEAVKHALLSVEGEPMFTAYDPPWTLPFLRRNEIAIKLAGLVV